MLVVPRFAFIKPALPMTAESPPCGPDDAVGTRLLTRNGYDWAQKYPLIVEAVNHLRVRSCLIDGEAAAATRTGLLCSRRCAGGERTRGCVYAFDLLELDGKDVRREPYEVRKATLASVLRQGRPGLRINEHLDYPGDMVFRHACKMGLEGIVSKRLGSYYRSGRTRDWLSSRTRRRRRLGGKRSRIGDADPELPIAR
jgi:bifunctional non-homologous end joining protein LigD